MKLSNCNERLRQRIEEQIRNEDHRKISSAVTEPPIRHDALAAPAGKEKNPGRFQVRVVSFRRRLIDPDNLTPKFFIDCLRYGGFIGDDSARQISFSVEQRECDQEGERTEIEITPIE